MTRSLESGASSGPPIRISSTLNWLQPSPTTYYYPTFRVDYNATEKLRLHVAFNETKEIQPAVAPSFLPGPRYSDQIAGNKNNNYTASLGVDWTISPTLVNEFKGGFLYNATWYAYNAAPLYATSAGAVSWNLPVPYPYGGNMSGQQFNLGINTNYPVFNASDSLTWQNDKHTIKFGFSWYREQDHYYNAPAGWPNLQPWADQRRSGAGGVLEFRSRRLLSRARLPLNSPKPSSCMRSSPGVYRV